MGNPDKGHTINGNTAFVWANNESEADIKFKRHLGKLPEKAMVIAYVILETEKMPVIDEPETT
jgi:hypothetical protein